jgi:hypothetical protein
MTSLFVSYSRPKSVTQVDLSYTGCGATNHKGPSISKNALLRWGPGAIPPPPLGGPDLIDISVLEELYYGSATYTVCVSANVVCACQKIYTSLKTTSM